MVEEVRMVSIVKTPRLVVALFLVLTVFNSHQLYASQAVGNGEPAQQVEVSEVKKALQAEASSVDKSASQPAPKLSEQWIEKTKNPVSWFRWGADLRAREEYIANPQFNSSLAEPETHHQRYRFRVWTDIQPVDQLSLHVRGLYVLRNFIDPSPVRGIDSGEILLDNLYLKFSGMQDSPYELRLGRQEFVDMGVPWLIMDGTSRDGSRTCFFDAARFMYRFADDETTLDAVYLYQSDRSDAWLPPIDMQESRKYLSEEDIQGGMILLRNKSLKNTTLESLFLYKHEYHGDLASSDYGDNFTIRPKVVYQFDDNWNLSTELAAQVGRRNGRDLLAAGSLSQLTYDFKDALKNRLWLGFEYLSGDRGGNGTDNGFDILWGRYPRVSETLAYTRVDSGKACDYSNMVSPFVGYSIKPLDQLGFQASYRPMFAPANPMAVSATHTESGSFKGHLVYSKLEYDIKPHIKTHMLFETILPGNYYAEAYRSAAYFFRAEVWVTW